MIKEWCVENQNDGVERIPTPKTLVTPLEASEICFGVKASLQLLEQLRCLELVQKNLAILFYHSCNTEYHTHFFFFPIQEFYCLFVHFVDCSAALLW
jgi:hypothetical protein